MEVRVIESFMRVYLDISNVPAKLFELRRDSSFKGSNYRECTVIIISCRIKEDYMCVTF